MNYRSIAPLAAYIDRIGAEELNFRRFMIKERRGGYYRQKALITIQADGTLKVTDDDYKPTDEEAAAIQVALTTVQFPRSIQAPAVKFDELVELIDEPSPDLTTFWDQASGQIIMVQQRIAGGQHGERKWFKPWSFWSDGQWRGMEPDGALPFWKPKEMTNKNRIMIHEGAKAAMAAQRIVDDAAVRHPWKVILSDYEHWGMIGGALSPHRADYNELRRINPAEVVYVCDNDQQGKDALPVISRHWKRRLRGVFFDDRWTASWDMADTMPGHLFGSDGLYSGPSLEDLMFSATWATDLVATGAKGGRMQAVIRQDFAEEWLHCTSPEVYIHVDCPHVIRDEKDFNNWIRPFSDVDDTARILKRSKTYKVGSLQYSPAVSSGFKAGRDDANYINTHTPSRIKAVEGDPVPWLQFLEHLIPDEGDRTELMRWCATLIARPSIKVLYGVLLISESQGVGKGTLGEKILLPILGKHNVSIPSENDVVESNFNYWAAHKRLAIIHEIYAGHSAKAYNKMKPLITDQYINVNKKFQAGYEIENWLHVFACSNSLRALQLGMDDRRWFVPKVTEGLKELAYWVRLNKWLNEENGLGIIVNWAHKWLEANAPVRQGSSAPMSAAKKEVVEEGYGPGQTLVNEYLRIANQRLNGDKVILLDVDLQQMIKDYVYEGRTNDRLERCATIRRVAKASGWYVNDAWARIERWGTRGKRAKIITNSEEFATMEPTDLAARSDVRRLNVNDTARSWLFSEVIGEGSAEPR